MCVKEVIARVYDESAGDNERKRDVDIESSARERETERIANVCERASKRERDG